MPLNLSTPLFYLELTPMTEVRPLQVCVKDTVGEVHDTGGVTTVPQPECVA